MAEEPQAPVQRKEFEVIDAAFEGAVVGYVWVFALYGLAAAGLISGMLTYTVVDDVLHQLMPEQWSSPVAWTVALCVAGEVMLHFLRNIRRNMRNQH